MRYASLPMYDLTEIRHATQAWWAGLARTFEAAGIDDELYPKVGDAMN